MEEFGSNFFPTHFPPLARALSSSKAAKVRWNAAAAATRALRDSGVGSESGVGVGVGGVPAPLSSSSSSSPRARLVEALKRAASEDVNGKVRTHAKAALKESSL